jgi:hypothetical protein
LPPAEETSGLSLTLVMPGLNEQANVERAVRRARAALERHAAEFEILVVDDGSSDETGAIAERLAAEDPRVRVLRNERNLNYGISLARGIRAARCEWSSTRHGLPLDRRSSRGWPPRWTAQTWWWPCARALLHRLAQAHLDEARLLQLLFRPRDLGRAGLPARLGAGPARARRARVHQAGLILRAERTGRCVREVAAPFLRRERGRAHFGRPKDILWTLRDMLRLRWHTWLWGWEA